MRVGIGMTRTGSGPASLILGGLRIRPSQGI